MQTTGLQIHQSSIIRLSTDWGPPRETDIRVTGIGNRTYAIAAIHFFRGVERKSYKFSLMGPLKNRDWHDEADAVNDWRVGTRPSTRFAGTVQNSCKQCQYSP
jgi:hypothetical protein